MLELASAVAVAPKKSDDTSGSSDDPTVLIRTRQMQLTAEQAAALFADNTALAGVCHTRICTLPFNSHVWVVFVSQKAAEAAKATPGSVIMEFQGPNCYQHVNDTLQGARFAAESATRDVIFVSKDTAAAL
jgi:hypothetical protein